MDLYTAIIVFIIAAIAIGLAGTLLARVSDQLADITGWGEALFGAVFLGATTSLPGIITSVVAATNNHPELAVSNAIGGIAAQTVFLCIADLSHPRINLEHAAASFANLMQAGLLIGLLALVLIGISAPEITLFNIDLFSFLMIFMYIAGTKLISKAKTAPMWNPTETLDTIKDKPDKNNLNNLSAKKVAFQFIMLSLLVGLAGYAVGKTGIIIAQQTGLTESFVGVLFTAVATSLPELIVAIAAVRQKALTLAVGTIIGGNTFDVLFVAFSDIGYQQGSILHAITKNQVFIIGLTILMTSILILGLLHREKKGIGKIGWESFTIILLYLAGNCLLFFL